MFDGEEEEDNHLNVNDTVVEQVDVKVNEKMKTMEPVIGIDLGTTNSCVGLWKPEEQSVEILKNCEGESTIPSWVGYNKNLEIVAIGKAAALSYNLFQDVKRIIGQTKAAVQKFERYLPFVI